MTDQNDKTVGVQFNFQFSLVANQGIHRASNSEHFQCELSGEGKVLDIDLIKATAAFLKHHREGKFSQLCMTGYTVDRERGVLFNPPIPFWLEDGEIKMGPIH